MNDTITIRLVDGTMNFVATIDGKEEPVKQATARVQELLERARARRKASR